MPELDNILKDIKSIGEKIEKAEETYVSKATFEKMADALKAYEVASERSSLENKTDRIFGNKAVARDFCDYLGYKLEKAGHSTKGGAFERTKATEGLSVATANEGAEYVPTSVATQIEYLLSQGGISRQIHTVFGGLIGSLDIPQVTDEFDDIKNDTSDGEVTGGVGKNATASVTLNPTQFRAIYHSSLKLIRNSSPAIAELIIAQLVGAMAKKEDAQTIVAYKASSIDKTITNTAVTAANLIDLIDKVHESVNPEDAMYLMNRATFVAAKKLLVNSEANNFVFDLTAGVSSLNGVPIKIWHRLDSFGVASNLVVLYGNFKKCGAVGTGRDMEITIDTGGENHRMARAAWRLLSDFEFKIMNAGAVAAIIHTPA